MKTRFAILIVFALVVGGFVAFAATVTAQTNDQWNLNDLINAVAQDINRMWAAEFAERELAYRPPNFIDGYVRRARTACGVVRIQTALYCGTSHSIHYEINFMNSAMRQIGDFAVAAVIAHEWGHAVQLQLGLLNSSPVERELQADCLAGAYANYAENVSEQVELSEGDVEEGSRLFSLIGDPEGLDVNDAAAHGTAEQRVEAYQTGYEEGIDGCF